MQPEGEDSSVKRGGLPLTVKPLQRMAEDAAACDGHTEPTELSYDAGTQRFP